MTPSSLLQIPPGVRFVVRKSTLWAHVREETRDLIAAKFFDALPSVFEDNREIVKAANEAWRTEMRARNGRWAKGGVDSATPFRLVLPRIGFEGERGQSLWRSSTGVVVEYRDGFPLFECAQIEGVNAHVTIELAHSRNRDFALADHALAQRLNWLNSHGKPDAARVRRARKSRRLTWHHVENCGEMMLVDTATHSTASHSGGFSLCH
ncbi:hypothetical protein EON83_25610 [bacterium]|nr:MAG: hypothetical protein EON83_25610 [bacterium]